MVALAEPNILRRAGPRSATVRVAGILAVTLPLVGFVSLLLREQLDRSSTTTRRTSSSSARPALLPSRSAMAGEAANRRGDARVLLLSLAFMATGGFMGLHAFGTAGVPPRAAPGSRSRSRSDYW